MAQTAEERQAKRVECQKRLHDERIAWGLCIRCGRPLNGVKTLQCSACLAKEAERREQNREKNREYMRRRIADHRARGLCVNCDAPAVRGGRCEYHREYYRLKNRERRKFKNADE